MKNSILKSARALGGMLPIITGIIMLVSLANAMVPRSFYSSVLTGNNFIDPFITALIGSISAGTPAVSYIISGELLKQGISLIAVTAFLLAWVTVGTIQMPAEGLALGKRFTILRNLSSYVLAIIIAVIIGTLLK